MLESKTGHRMPETYWEKRAVLAENVLVRVFDRFVAAWDEAICLIEAEDG